MIVRRGIFPKASDRWGDIGGRCPVRRNFGLQISGYDPLFFGPRSVRWN